MIIKIMLITRMLALMKVYFSLLYVEWRKWMPKNVIECWLKCKNRYWIWFMGKCSLFHANECIFAPSVAVSRKWMRIFSQWTAKGVICPKKFKFAHNVFEVTELCRTRVTGVTAIARNRGLFAPVINCQRNLIFKMTDKNDRSQGKRIPCDFLNNLGSVDLFYEEKSWNKTPCKKMLGLYSVERLIATKQYADVPFVTFSWQFCFKTKPGRLVEDFWMPGT